MFTVFIISLQFQTICPNPSRQFNGKERERPQKAHDFRQKVDDLMISSHLQWLIKYSITGLEVMNLVVKGTNISLTTEP